MSGKSIYLHIGMPKTASSALQVFFHQNRELLKGHGILYPETCLSGPAQHKFAHALANGNQKEIEHQSQNILQEINKSPQERVLISSESLCRLKDCEQLKRIFGSHEITAIVYLRRQDLWLESAYKQNIRSHLKRLTVDFGQYVESRSHKRHTDFEQMLSPWEKTFGRHNIVVRAFESGQIKKDIFTDFMSILQVEVDARFSLPSNGMQSNISLSNELAEFLRIANSLDLNQKQHLELVGLLNRIVEDGIIPKSNKPYLFTNQLRESFLSSCEEGNRNIAQTYFERPQLFLDPVKNASEDEVFTGLGLEQIIQIFSALLTIQGVSASRRPDHDLSMEPGDSKRQLSSNIGQPLQWIKKMFT